MFRAVQKLERRMKQPRSYDSPLSFADLATDGKRYLSFRPSKRKWTDHLRQMQSTPNGEGMPIGGCKCADLTESYAVMNELCPYTLLALDPRSYTAGRWLRCDKLHRESRYIEFDFHALCKRAIGLCPGAASIASHEKNEGGYNKVFTFTMNNGGRIVARLPTHIAGPPKLTTNSEVATIRYCELKPLLFDDTDANPCVYQCNPKQVFRSQKSLNGVMTLQMLSAASTLLWNTREAFNCITCGQQCPWVSRLGARGLLSKISSRWPRWTSLRTVACITTALISIPHRSIQSHQAMSSDLIVAYPTGIVTFASQGITAQQSLTGDRVSPSPSNRLAFVKLIHYRRGRVGGLLLRAH